MSETIGVLQRKQKQATCDISIDDAFSDVPRSAMAFPFALNEKQGNSPRKKPSEILNFRTFVKKQQYSFDKLKTLINIFQ